jgi:type II secretory pathway pseudopilin PulG
MAAMASPSSARGFTLIETLVATGILITALAGVAQLFVLGAHLTRRASTSTMALMAAQEKLEALRGLPFDFDWLGEPVTDPVLQASPPSSLAEDSEPFVDWLNAAADPVRDAANAAFVRRWRVTSLGDTNPDSIAIEVCVFAMPGAERGADGADVCLSTIRTRQP